MVKGFGDISADSKKIIEMESIVEGLTLVFIRAVVLAVSLIDRTSAVSKAVYLLSFVTLNVLSVVSLKTGFKINFPPFRLCPVIFTTASIMILLGSYM
ncbi:MAG: hypothetical protein ACYSWO_02760 [Planctomycetota bacterium]